MVFFMRKNKRTFMRYFLSEIPMKLRTIVISAIFLQAGSAMDNQLVPVPGFDLNCFLGKWYEIARLPTSFERNLGHVTATYSLREDGKVKVLNEGRNVWTDKYSKAVGKAKIAQDPTVGYLKVSFFWPFYADYIILELDKEGYNYAMVASSFKYLWILSRTPGLDKEILERLVKKAKELGFDTDKIYFTPQGPGDSGK